MVTAHTPWQRPRHPLVWAAVGTVLVGVVALYLGVWGTGYGLDLHVYRDGVERWVHGASPYGHLYTVHDLPYTYPPFSLVAFAPLALLPFTVTQVLWWVLGLAALVGAVAVAARAAGWAPGSAPWGAAVGWAVASVLVVEPARSTFDYGQVNAVLLGLVVADLLLVPSRHRGWLVGLAAAVKLTPIVFVLVPLVERDLRSAARTVLGFVALSGVTWALWPGPCTHYWLHQVASPGQIGPVGGAANQSLYGVLHRAPFPSTGEPALWAVAGLAVLAMTCVAARGALGRGDRLGAVLAVALCGLLVSPVSWSHHWIWVVLVPVVVARRGAAGPGPAVRVALGGLLAVAVAAPYWWWSSGPGGDALQDLMPLWAVGVLGLWCAEALVPRRSGPGAGRRGPRPDRGAARWETAAPTVGAAAGRDTAVRDTAAGDTTL